MPIDPGLPDDVYLRETHRLAGQHGYQHAWPTFELAIYPASGTQVGQHFLKSTVGAAYVDVRKDALQNSPVMTAANAGPIFWAANRWANDNGFASGMPVFEQATGSQGVVYGVICHPHTDLLHWQDVLVSDLQDTPSIGDGGQTHEFAKCMWSANRWALSHGYAAGWPSFEHGELSGQRCYGLYLMKANPDLFTHDIELYSNFGRIVPNIMSLSVADAAVRVTERDLKFTTHGGGPTITAQRPLDGAWVWIETLVDGEAINKGEFTFTLVHYPGHDLYEFEGKVNSPVDVPPGARVSKVFNRTRDMDGNFTTTVKVWHDGHPTPVKILPGDFTLDFNDELAEGLWTLLEVGSDLAEYAYLEVDWIR